jgi:hypothetical protein
MRRPTRVNVSAMRLDIGCSDNRPQSDPRRRPNGPGGFVQRRPVEGLRLSPLSRRIRSRFLRLIGTDDAYIGRRATTNRTAPPRRRTAPSTASGSTQGRDPCRSLCRPGRIAEACRCGRRSSARPRKQPPAVHPADGPFRTKAATRSASATCLHLVQSSDAAHATKLLARSAGSPLRASALTTARPQEEASSSSPASLPPRNETSALRPRLIRAPFVTGAELRGRVDPIRRRDRTTSLGPCQTRSDSER